MSHDLPKAYDPSAIEARWADYWVKEKLFHVATPAEKSENIFTILLPPPNVTGRLHMGHMLNQTEMDILTRWHRMLGETSLWLPGTDHAGIATQMMVERQLASENKKRQDLGREKFVERVWEWKHQYGGAITEQMRRLGASVDWQREYFTMDENLSNAVKEVFVRLYEARDSEGRRLIYRGEYIVNWCPRCGTAISDLEVVHEEQQGKLYEIRYPVNGSSGEFVTIATTRPETMLGDVAVAVNPRDERYAHLRGKTLRLPLMERHIPIIEDELANPEFGTGAVKVTPAHDPNDFQAGLRHNLEQLNIMTPEAKINENGGPYAGLDRFEARKRVLADLEAGGFLVAVKDHTLNIGKCDRCKTVVEPRISTQWFVRIQPLADRAIAAVEQGFIRFTPENYKTIYLNWMRNIYDWCISRQLWWGHRIPAWHCGSCGEINVEREAPQKCHKCGGTALVQDPDVLDTWFSSALLPFTTFGWPQQTKDLEVFYPTKLLVTGFDILFFWVARMIMMGCWFMGGENAPLDLAKPEDRERLKSSVPFEEVYIHALVRDAERQKMSKTKGNVLDPIEVIERFGTDATRFTLAAMASPGTDIAFNENRTEGYRNFANKIWNAARFIFMNVDRAQEAGDWKLASYLERRKDKSSVAPVVDGQRANGPLLSAHFSTSLDERWIFARAQQTAAEVNAALAGYRFHEAANLIYSFFWGDFCDWYLETVKLRLDFSNPEKRPETLHALEHLLVIFEYALVLLSPFMPFITEEIWHALWEQKTPKKSIALLRYPQGLAADHPQYDREAVEQMSILQALIQDIRNRRAELKVEPKAKTPIQVFAGERVAELIREQRYVIEKLANVEGIQFMESSIAKQPGTKTAEHYEVAVIFEVKIDPVVERDRLNKELQRLEKEYANAQRQLGNEAFLSKAPAQVVEGLRRRNAELETLIPKTKSSLEQLGG